MKAKELQNLSDAEAIRVTAPLFVKNARETGIFASLSIAQFIYESDYGKSDLALSSNNLFGMKASLSGNTWENSTWDGRQCSRRVTLEMDEHGNYYEISEDFRVYNSIEESIEDHGMYLLHARNGNVLRYAGLCEAKTPEEGARILKAGSYSTSIHYAENLAKIIRVWNLKRFDRSGE